MLGGNPIPCNPGAEVGSSVSGCKIFTVRKKQPNYHITAVTEDGGRTVLKTIKAWQLSSASGVSELSLDLAPSDKTGHPSRVTGNVALNLFFTQIRLKMALAANRCANTYSNVILVFDDFGRLVLHNDGSPLTFNPETIAQTISSERYDADALSGSYNLSLVVDQTTGAPMFDKRGHVVAFDPTTIPKASRNAAHDTYTIDTARGSPCG
jgi:hypothetical protein